ncbi:MAG: Maf family protein [Verrucomicrobium sp.]|jgi:septum formation protein|nr:Maf family protein [Verrucomicrobium sp.]
MTPPPLVLASASPRRVELLRTLVPHFQVLPSDAAELHDAGLGVRPLCEENARLKAAAVAKAHPGSLVIGADTLVWIDGQPLGKPADLTEAVAMLHRLSGREHQVVTGVCLIHGATGRCEGFSDLTRVRFRPLDDAGIDRYLAAVHTLDKAGGYALQQHGDWLVESVTGSRSNVIGLPVEALREALERWGVPMSPPAGCVGAPGG